MIVLPSCANTVALGLLACLPFSVGIKLDLENDGRSSSSFIGIRRAEQRRQTPSKVPRAL
jgi:hypothetical protein